MGRVGAIVLCLGLAGAGCSRQERAGEPRAVEQAPEALPKYALRMSRDRLSGLVLKLPGAAPVHLLRDEGRWRVDAPVKYPAHLAAVEPMEDVLSELLVVRRVAVAPEPSHRLGEEGIEVRLQSAEGHTRRFVVGASVGDETFVQIGDEPTVFAVRGRCRRFFARSLADLRDPVITDVDVTRVTRAVFESVEGRLEFVPDKSVPGRFLPRGLRIRNFDGDRARQAVAVAARLRAAGYVDEPVDRAATGLFTPETPSATLFFEGIEAPLRVWIGTRRRDRRLYLRTSRSPQVFLVSAHLMSSLVPRRAHFERSDTELRQARELAAKRVAQAGLGESSAHHDEAHHDEAQHEAHTHRTPPPTEVPQALLTELRALAAAQRSASERGAP